MRAMQGIGIDIEEKDRFIHIRFLDRFLEFIMTKQEIEIAKLQPDIMRYIGSRFVAKEAVVKAVPEIITYRDFEIQKKDKKIVVIFNERYKKYKVHLSISHAPAYYAAVAIVE